MNLAPVFSHQWNTLPPLDLRVPGSGEHPAVGRLPGRAAAADRSGDFMAELVGNLLDSLGVEYHHEDGDLVASAVVLLKVIDVDGNVSLRTLCSDGISWIERIGMLRAAESVELPGAFECVGDDDE